MLIILIKKILGKKIIFEANGLDSSEIYLENKQFLKKISKFNEIVTLKSSDRIISEVKNLRIFLLMNII